MENYEGLFIIDPDLSADISKQTIDAITDIIVKQEGVISETSEWGRRKLSYLIQKKREGVYVLFTFSIKPETIARLHSLLRLNDQILKYLITRKVPVRQAPPARIPKKQFIEQQNAAAAGIDAPAEIEIETE